MIQFILINKKTLPMNAVQLMSLEKEGSIVINEMLINHLNEITQEEF